MKHTFFVHFFAVVLHDYNVKLPCYTFYTGNVYRNNLRFPSLVVSASQDAGGYAISRQNNLELHLGCPNLLIELFYIGMPVVRTDRRAGGRAYGDVISKISRMGRLPHFLRCGATLARSWISAYRDLRYGDYGLRLRLNMLLRMIKTT